jgi:hypothetical protein
MTNNTENEVILEGPETYHAWFAMIMGSVQEDLWEYFDPDSAEEYKKPDPFTMDSVKPGAGSLRELTASERGLYASLRNAYNHEVTQYQRYLSEQSKLRTKILSTIVEAKRTLLRADKSVRNWITNIQTSTKPTDAQMKDIVRARHRVLLGAKYSDWPTAGPEKWLTEWQKLMVDCERWSPALYEDWAGDLNLVWGEVPGAKRLCDRLVEATTDGGLEEWDIFRATRELRQAWEQKSIRSGMKIAGKGKITRAAFPTEPRFDGRSPEDHEETSPQQSPKPTSGLDQLRNGSKPRKRAGTGTVEKEGKQRGRKRTAEPCWGCGGAHSHFQCYLISERNPKNLQFPQECHDIFNEKMKDPAFVDKLRIIREANKLHAELSKAASNRE